MVKVVKCIGTDVAIATRLLKMAADVEVSTFIPAMVSTGRLEGTLVAPDKTKEVPNHLTETSELYIVGWCNPMFGLHIPGTRTRCISLGG